MDLSKKAYLNIDLFLISFLAIISAVWLRMEAPASLPRAILALMLLLFLPGYAFYSALFVRHLLGGAERILIIAGSSISIAIVAGIILNFMSGGLNPASWAALLCGFTLISCLIAGLRRNNAGYKTYQPLNLNLGWGQAAILVLALLVTIGAVSLARTPITNPANLQGYTVLWILPVGNEALNAVNLGVTNDQFTTTEYKLQILTNHQVLNEWPDIKLAPGEKMETAYEIPGNLSTSTEVEAYLYKLDNPDTVYRQVKLFVGP